MSNEVVSTIVSTVEVVADTAVSTEIAELEAKIQALVEEFVAEKTAEIAATSSSSVKLRDQLYITLVEAAETYVLAHIETLGDKALTYIEKVLAKYE
jgi:hypothetical protein